MLTEEERRVPALGALSISYTTITKRNEDGNTADDNDDGGGRQSHIHSFQCRSMERPAGSRHSCAVTRGLQTAP